VDVRDYPPGITVLGLAPVPAADAPVIHVRNLPSGPNRGPEPIVLPWPEWNIAFVIPPLGRATPAPAPAAPQAITIGPGPEEQLAVFGKRGVHPGVAGTPLPARSTWTPSSAWPVREDPHPYPWNPARFSRPAFDPVWAPTESWSRRNALPDGSRVTWPAPPVENVWEPGDAWNRTVLTHAPSTPPAAPAPSSATEPAPQPTTAAPATPSAGAQEQPPEVR
jgi:hypothetical protein